MIDFQQNVLHFLLTRKEGKEYIQLLEGSFFELAEHKFIFSLLQQYFKEYSQLPSKVNLMQYFRENTDAKEALADAVRYEISAIYSIDIEDFNIVEKSVVRSIKARMLKELISENLSELNSDKVIDKLQRGMSKIDKIGSHDEHNEIWVFDEVVKRKRGEAHPCCFKGVNELTAKKGFSSPELIGWLSDPKLGKTATLVSLAVGYAIDGLNVVYCDCENGEIDIAMRIQQALGELTFEELQSGEHDSVLRQQMDKIKKLKGKVVVLPYKAYVSTLDDVDNDLERLGHEGFKPDVILYDYLDLFKSADRSIKDDTKVSQDVCHHAIRLNRKYNMHGHSPSQAVRSAIGSETKGMKDFGRDIGKAHNYHAAFYIAQTPDEAKGGVGRIGVVFQRMGAKFGEVDIVIDGERSLLYEYQKLTDD